MVFSLQPNSTPFDGTGVIETWNSLVLYWTAADSFSPVCMICELAPHQDSVARPAGCIERKCHGAEDESTSIFQIHPPSNSRGSLVMPDSIGNSVYHISSLKMHPYRTRTMATVLPIKLSISTLLFANAKHLMASYKLVILWESREWQSVFQGFLRPQYGGSHGGPSL